MTPSRRTVCAGLATLFAAHAAAAAEQPAPAAFLLADRFRQPDDPDDAAALRRAIAAAGQGGGIVVLAARTYRIGATVELPTGIVLAGTGAVLGQDPVTVPGTTLRRTAECVMLRARGRGFRAGGPMTHSLQLHGILFDGGDFRSDLVQFISTARVIIQACAFHRSQGRHLLMHELFDSRVVDTDFEWGGNPDGDVPMIELRSGDGLEYTNHVHFLGCRCESYPGTAIALTGGNTNKIYLTNCKLESLNSNLPALTAAHADGLHLAGLQITARGTPGARLRSLIAADDCAFVIGDVLLEHAAYEGGARLSSYLELNRCRGVDLAVSVIDGQTALPVELYISAVETEACSIRGLLRRGRTVIQQRWDI